MAQLAAVGRLTLRRADVPDGKWRCGEKFLRFREFDPFCAEFMESSFASRYANARERKFLFRLRQDIVTGSR